MGEVIVVTSGKGGVGKTTTTANIGAGLAKLGKKVLMIDTDTGLRNLDIVVGLENQVIYNLIDIVEDKCKIEDAVIPSKAFENLFMISTAQLRDKSAVTPEQMKDLLEKLKESYDYIILDSPAGIEQGFKNAAAGADRAIVVTVPDLPSVRDADRIIHLLEDGGISRLHLIINKLRPSLVAKGGMISVEEISELLGRDLIGIIPDDENVLIASKNGRPLVGEDNPAGKAYMNICKRILGEEIAIPTFEEEKQEEVVEERRGFFGLFRKKKK